MPIHATWETEKSGPSSAKCLALAGWVELPAMHQLTTMLCAAKDPLTWHSGVTQHLSLSLPSQGHSTCVTEHEKYALGATKPGGYASQGFYKEGGAAAAPQQQQQQQGGGSEEELGLEFLSERPPWKCRWVEQGL
jgi:hypothetical protein